MVLSIFLLLVDASVNAGLCEGALMRRTSLVDTAEHFLLLVDVSVNAGLWEITLMIKTGCIEEKNWKELGQDGCRMVGRMACSIYTSLL